MCTVTFIPVKGKVFLTSNRDEQHKRSIALEPEVYTFERGRILFPKDGDAGGTWIAAHENGHVVVFLNGGWVKHTPAPPYRKSRGLILLDLIDSASPYNSFLAINLNNIEPFTAVVWDDGHLFECRWDGTIKHQRQLNHHEPHIWSSVTLYDPPVIQTREQWFRRWLQQLPFPQRKDILDFHRFTGNGDTHNDLMMHREGHATVSVTSVMSTEERISMQYLDILQQQTSLKEMVCEKTMAGR